MKGLVRKLTFAVMGTVLLCLPTTVWAEPLDTGYLDAPEITEPITAPELDSLLTDIEAPEPTDAPHLSKDVVSIHKPLLVSIGSTSGIKLVPGGMYEVFLGDTSLGSYPADQNGQLFVQVTVPVDTSVGMHTLKISDNQILLQKSIRIIDR